MNRETYLLKKQLENRESTIDFLNGIIDAQSKSIDELKLRLGMSEDDSPIYHQSYKELEEYNNYLEDEISRLERKNNELKAKLDILFKAFASVKNVDTVQTDESTNKIRHKKELLSDEWQEKRKEVFEKYGKQCIECGSTDNIHVHHLVYKKGRHVWEYGVDELIPLCKKCHEKVHSDKNHKFHEKYIS